MRKIISLILIIIISAVIFGCIPNEEKAIESSAYTEKILLTDEQVDQIILNLTTTPTHNYSSIVDNPDSRFIIPLVDIYTRDPTKVNDILQNITNQKYTTLDEWKNFCERNEISISQGYTEWKLETLREKSSVIPNSNDVILNPNTLVQHIYIKYPQENTADALNKPLPYEGKNKILVTIESITQTYSLKDLQERHVINDKIGNTFITLTYCDICNTPVVYNTTQIEGSHFTFEPTNLAYQDNTIIIDSETNTLWNSVTGYPVLGFLADKGVELEILSYTILK